MDKDYLKQFSNENVEKLLLQPSAIPILEDILNREINLYSKLKDKRLNFGKVPSPQELFPLLEETKPEVDEFLGVSEIKNPGIQYHSQNENILLLSLGIGISGGIGSCVITKGLYFGFEALDYVFIATSLFISAFGSAGIYYNNTRPSEYSPEKGISLKKQKRELIIPVIAHEYTHHVQKEKGFPYEKFECLREGQARSVQNAIALKWMEEDNPSSLCGNIVYNLPEVRSVYFWSAEKNRRTPNPYLCEEQESKYDKFLRDRLRKQGKPTEHALGNAFFSTLEAREGTGIHKEIMAGRYQLPSF